MLFNPSNSRQYFWRSSPYRRPGFPQDCAKRHARRHQTIAARFLPAGVRAVAAVWLIGAALGRLSLPINLPVAALMTFNPMIAALCITYWEDDRGGATALLRRAVDLRSVEHPAWFIVAILLMQLVLVLAYCTQVLTGGTLPSSDVPLAAVPSFFLMFFIGGIGEELGWQGFIFERLLGRWNALQAALILGVIWALGTSCRSADRSRDRMGVLAMHDPGCAARIMASLYLGSGRSVFIAILFHAMSNMSEFLFPNYG